MQYLNNSIIICNSNHKKNILMNLTKEKKLLNINFFSKEEFINNYFFSYNEDTLIYLVNKYNYKIDIAKVYLDNLYYIDDTLSYTNNKLKFLKELKEELNNKGLLIYNNSFKNFIKNKNIYIIGYPILDNYLLKELNNYNVIYEDIKPINKTLSIYEFNTLDEEVDFVFRSISKLINNGISLNKIKLMGIDNSYYNILKRYSYTYNIYIDIPTDNTLYNTKEVKTFLDTLSINDIYGNRDIINKIINICNKYSKYDLSLIKDILIDDFKHTRINNCNYQEYIELIDIGYPIQDEYVFFLGFNQGNIPKVYKDEDYITDNICSIVDKLDTYKKNKLYESFFIDYLYSIDNLTISYKLLSNKKEYPSSLINKLKVNIIKDNLNYLESYSYKDSLLKYISMLDNYYKYGIYNDLLGSYYKVFSNYLYNSYNNNYSNIDINDLYDYLDNNLVLSYSSLDNYNKCPFRFYITNILKLDKYEDKFETFIGRVFHYVLEQSLKNDTPVDLSIKEFLSKEDRFISKKELFFLDNIKEEMIFTIDYLRNVSTYSKLDNSLFEERITLKYDGVIPVTIKGFVDKIMYKEFNGKTYVSIVDYKTGNVSIDFNFLDKGVNIQLPMYLYLVKNSNLFNDIVFAGFYIEYILQKVENNSTKDIISLKRDNLKLVGYSNSDIDILEKFDNTYEDSEFIKGLKLNKNGGFNAYSKVVSNEEIDNIIYTIDTLVKSNIKDILNGIFDIAPKKIDGKDYGCKYCKYKDLCFMKEDNYVNLSSKKEEDSFNTIIKNELY